MFDWTILKHPQVGSSSRSRASIYFDIVLGSSFFLSIVGNFLNNFLLLQPGKPPVNAGPSAERVEKTPGLLGLLITMFLDLA